MSIDPAPWRSSGGSSGADAQYEFLHGSRRAASAVSELVFSVLQEGHQENKRLSAFQLLHRNHENGLDFAVERHFVEAVGDLVLVVQQPVD